MCLSHHTRTGKYLGIASLSSTQLKSVSYRSMTAQQTSVILPDSFTIALEYAPWRTALPKTVSVAPSVYNKDVELLRVAPWSTVASSVPSANAFYCLNNVEAKAQPSVQEKYGCAGSRCLPLISGTFPQLF